MLLQREGLFLALLLLSSRAAQGIRAPQLQQEFIQAMQAVEEANRLAAQQETLQDRLLQVAEKVTPQFLQKNHRNLGNNNNYNYYNGNNGNYNGNNNNYNNNNNYQNGGNNYNYNGGNNNYNYNQQQNNQGNNNNNNDENNQAYQEYKQYNGGYRSNTDLTEYALKYVGCQNIHTWSDDLVQEGSEPLAMKRYAILRLCESDSCSAYNKWGCNYNYGEYALPMETYLEIMSSYHFEQYSRYCETCTACQTFDYTPYKQYKQQQRYNQNYYNQGNNNNNYYNDDFGNDYYGDDDVAVYYQYTYGSDQNNAANQDDYFNDDAVNNDDGAAAANNDDGAAANGDDGNYYAADDGNRKLYNDDYNYNGNNGNYNGNNYNGNNYNGNNGNYLDDSYAQVPWYIDRYGKCMFDNVCSDYKTLCQSYDENAAMYQDYFACSEFQLGNQKGYLGPHCRSDGHTIGIAIYGDEDCNSYVSDVAELGQYTAQSFDDSELSPFYDNACVSCKSSESYVLLRDGNYANGQEYTYPLCGAAFDNSARCHKYMDSDSYLYQSDEDEMDQVCPFIASLVENNYDESGEVLLAQEFDFSQWKSPQQYMNIARKTSPRQIVALILSMVAVLCLLVHAMHLRKKLFSRLPWKAPRHVNDPISGYRASLGEYDARAEAGRLSRSNSGIVAARTSSFGNNSASNFSGTGTSGIVAGRSSIVTGTITHGDLSYTGGRTTDTSSNHPPSEGAFA